MSSSDIAISVQGLGKSYTINNRPTGQFSTLAEKLLSGIRFPSAGKAESNKTFWALKDVSFEIPRGEVVGIVGRNGAGKSTLLKILSQITEPTLGHVDLYGRVGSLLEVGTGFHPELTGSENIYLNGQILGMRRAEIAREFDQIVDFSGVEQFLDTPVKRYSSGMYVRLAFAVAAHLRSEILVIDEVLAVGDAEFQKKCLGKVKDVATSGRTVLFVSHHMQSVKLLCDRALHLEAGKVTHFGSVDDVLHQYASSYAKAQDHKTDPEARPGSGEMRLTHVSPAKEFYECGEEKTIRFTISRCRPFSGKLFVACLVHSQNHGELLHCDSRMAGGWIEAAENYSGEFVLRTPWLRPGSYRIDLFLCSAGILDSFEHACNLEVLPILPYSAPDNPEATARGVVFADFDFRQVPATSLT